MDSQKKDIPQHIGIIMDGNRRWAEAHGKKPIDGHKQGYQVLKDILRACKARGIKYVSVYAFSTENWERVADEVKYLMSLAEWVLKNELDELHEENAQVHFLGSRSELKPNLINLIEAAEAKTKNNTAVTLGICFNYGGQQEIVDAVKTLIEQGTEVDEVTPELIAEHLHAPDLPPLDFIIRTSGEQRLSNFMLWRAAYAELYFTDKHWPDFTADDLDVALNWYSDRERRYGK